LYRLEDAERVGGLAVSLFQGGPAPSDWLGKFVLGNAANDGNQEVSLSENQNNY